MPTRADASSMGEMACEVPGIASRLRAGWDRRAGARVVHSGQVSVIKVFVLDDHEIVRQGVLRLIDAQPDMSVVGEAGTAAEALARAPLVGADVAVLDVRLPDGNGVEVCRDLRSALPDLHCLMLTSFADDEALLDAIT